MRKLGLICAGLVCAGLALPAAYYAVHWYEYDSHVETDLFSLGQVAANGGDCGKAIEYYRTLLKKDPRHAMTVQLMAECQVKLRNLKGAIESYEELLKLESTPDRVKRLEQLKLQTR